MYTILMYVAVICVAVYRAVAFYAVADIAIGMHGMAECGIVERRTAWHIVSNDVMVF